MTDRSTMILSFDVGRKNLAVCLLAAGGCARGSADCVRQWAVLTADPTPAGIARALDEGGVGAWLDASSDVVIERQPLKNPTMTRLQHYIEMWCCMRGAGAGAGADDAGAGAGADRPVYVQDAKHKLAFAAGTPYWPPGDVDSWTYHMRKKLSVQTAQAFLAATPGSHAAGLATRFAASKKKDDFADCLLQAMAYAHHVRPLEPAGPAAKKKVVARKPTDTQLKRGALTKPGVKWLLKGCLGSKRGRAAAAAEATVEDRVRLAASKNPALAKSIDKLWGGVAECVAELAPS